jgi:hypothetical protein
MVDLYNFYNHVTGYVFCISIYVCVWKNIGLMLEKNTMELEHRLDRDRVLEMLVVVLLL